MTEFSREVDEEYRRAQIAAIFKKYGNLIIGALLLIVIGIGGWQFVQWRQTKAAQAAAVAFENALKLAGDAKGAEAEAALGAIAADASNPYAALAKLRQAGALSARDKPAGVKAFDAVAADATIELELRNAARIRAAYLLVDTAKREDITTRIGDLAGAGGNWRNAAREIIGLAAYRAGDMEGAAKSFEEIATDPAAPQGMRARADLFIELSRGAAKAN
jgi:hypothetical protein